MNFEKALSNLKDLCLCFNNNNVEYWISCGTLLGVIRESGLIKHDEDVDVCVNSKYLSSELVQSIKNFGFKIKSSYGRIDDGFELVIERFGEKIDIFFFYKNQDYWYHSVYANFSKENYDKYDYVFEPFELTTLEFDGFLYSIPKNPESVLEQQYGPNWRVPDKNWSYYKSPYNIRVLNKKFFTSDSKKDLKRLMSVN